MCRIRNNSTFQWLRGKLFFLFYLYMLIISIHYLRIRRIKMLKKKKWLIEFRRNKKEKNYAPITDYETFSRFLLWLHVESRIYIIQKFCLQKMLRQKDILCQNLSQQFLFNESSVCQAADKTFTVAGMNIYIVISGE